MRRNVTLGPCNSSNSLTCFTTMCWLVFPAPNCRERLQSLLSLLAPEGLSKGVSVVLRPNAVLCTTCPSWASSQMHVSVAPQGLVVSVQLAMGSSYTVWPVVPRVHQSVAQIGLALSKGSYFTSFSPGAPVLGCFGGGVGSTCGLQQSLKLGWRTWWPVTWTLWNSKLFPMLYGSSSTLWQILMTFCSTWTIQQWHIISTSKKWGRWGGSALVFSLRGPRNSFFGVCRSFQLLADHWTGKLNILADWLTWLHVVL